VAKNITKELICREALHLIKEGGMAKLSMRNLAARLNIKAPSLYVHIKNKADLITLLQDYTFKTHKLADIFTPNSSNWRELLSEIMRNMRDIFKTKTWLFELFASYQFNSDDSRQTFEHFLNKMMSFGFTLKQAGYIGRNLRIFVIGNVTFETRSTLAAREHLQLAENIKPEFKLNQQFYNALTENQHDEMFEFGINIMLDGCEKLLQ
jgi:AcrR family transcriptional regulator